MKTLRLLVTEVCNRGCPGCVNNDWDLNALPVCTDFTEFSMIILTGGEPLLDVPLVLDVVDRIRETNPTAMVIVYTAYASRVLHVLPYVNGVTLTMHNQADVIPVQRLVSTVGRLRVDGVPWAVNSSLRLNVFEGVEFGFYTPSWKVKSGIQWIKDCPLPANEVFMRL